MANALITNVLMIYYLKEKIRRKKHIHPKLQQVIIIVLHKLTAYS